MTKFNETHSLVFRVLTTLMLCIVASAGGAHAQEDIEELEELAIRKAVDSIASSVIRFETIGGTNRVDGAMVANGPATGVAISKDGYVISASFHFAHQPASIFARLPNGKRASAEIVGRDSSRKLVLLKIQSDFEFSVPVPANSESVRVGETVIAVGRVIDAELPSVSTGVVSAKNRIWDRAIQTDAKVSPANFGGPLLSLDGKMIGILVPMSPDDDGELAGTEWYDSGIGFAVPFDKTLLQVDRLKQGLTLRKGLIGVSIDGSDLYADPAIVGFCRGSSPAAKAGILPGDEIVEINGRPIVRQSEMMHALGPLYENDIVIVKVIRDGKRWPFEVKLAGEIESYIPPGIGLLMGNLPNNKLAVVEVFKGGAAEAAGIETGDQITHFNGNAIHDQSELRQAIASEEVSSRVQLMVQRNGKAKQIDTTIGKRESTIPVQLPVVEGGRDAKVIQLNIADVPNECFAVVPEPTGGGTAPALVVWIPEPGKLKQEAIEKTWAKYCLMHHVTVLVPLSANETKWLPGEADFILSAVDRLAKRAKFDSNRVVVGGTGTGGAMASLVAFRQRDLFQGLVVLDSGLSNRARRIETSPVEPLLVLLGSNGQMNEQQKSSADTLRQAHVPFSLEEKGKGTPLALWIDDLMKWTRAVNRF